MILRLLLVLSTILMASSATAQNVECSVLCLRVTPSHGAESACEDSAYFEAQCPDGNLRPAAGLVLPAAGLPMPRGSANSDFAGTQSPLLWGAIGSGYASDKLIVFIVTGYATRAAARRAAMQECMRRELRECEIPILATSPCYAVVRNPERTWFQSGPEAGKLAADLLRQCREEGGGSACYVEQIVCTDS